MNAIVGRPEIGQWYARTDKGELFRVVARDDKSRTIEIQTYDGEVDEIDAETWSTLPLELSEEPEDWTAPLDNVENDDLGYSETAMTPADRDRALQPLRVEGESWEEAEPEEAPEVPGEGALAEPFSAEIPEASELGR